MIFIYFYTIWMSFNVYHRYIHLFPTSPLFSLGIHPLRVLQRNITLAVNHAFTPQTAIPDLCAITSTGLRPVKHITNHSCFFFMCSTVKPL